MREAWLKSPAVSVPELVGFAFEPIACHTRAVIGPRHKMSGEGSPR